MRLPNDAERDAWRTMAMERARDRAVVRVPCDVKVANAKEPPPPPERIVEPVDGDEAMPDYLGAAQEENGLSNDS